MLEEPTDIHYQLGAELLHILQQRVAADRKSYHVEDMVVLDIGYWHYPQEFLCSKGMVNLSPKCRIVPDTEEQWVATFNYPATVEGMSQADFDRCLAATGESITAIGKHLDDIFKVIDPEAGIIRTPRRAALGWNQHGTVVIVTITSTHVVERYNPYKKAESTDVVQETAS